MLAYPALATALGVRASSPADTYLAWTYLVAVPLFVWVAGQAWDDEREQFLVAATVLVTISTTVMLADRWVDYARGVGSQWLTAEQQIVRAR